jgi:hypothetical protein
MVSQLGWMTCSLVMDRKRTSATLQERVPLDGTDGTSLECNKKICDQLIDFGPRQKSDPRRLAFGSITMNEDQKVWGGVVRMWKETEMISHFLS